MASDISGLELEYEKPHVVTASEKRRVIDNFHRSYRTATMPGGEDDDDRPLPCPEPGRHCLQQHLLEAVAAPASSREPEEEPLAEENAECLPEECQPRQFVACVFCALLRWSEEQRQAYIAGPWCFMKSPRLVSELLSANAYAEA